MNKKKQVTEVAPWISGEEPSFYEVLTLHEFRLDYVPEYKAWWTALVNTMKKEITDEQNTI